jgi:hypothetical protein
MLIVCELTAVSVPVTVKFPSTDKLPVTLRPSSIVINDESEDESVEPEICNTEF